MAEKSYCAQVLGALKRVTAGEKAKIAQELNDHMEDHAAALEEIGYTADEAWEKAEASMGDPVEMARELDKQYPMGWLILKRAAVTAVFLLCFVVFMYLGMFYFIFKSTWIRFVPPDTEGHSNDFTITTASEPDLRMAVGSDRVRVYEVNLGTTSGGKTDVQVGICVYDRFPGGVVSQALTNNLTLTSANGASSYHMGGNSSWFYAIGYLYVPYEPGDEAVTLSYSAFGDRYELTIPLPKEGEP